MQAITYTYRHKELELHCELEYDPPSPDDGFPSPEAFLLTAKVGGIDIAEVLDDKIIERIEEAAAWSMLE